MSQSNIENLKKQYENISEAAKAEFTLSQKLQGAIDEINTWSNNDSNYGGSSSNNDNDNGNYDNDNNDD